MSWNEGLTQLQNILSELYDDESSSQEVVRKANLPDGKIEYSSAKQKNWYNILQEAHRQKKVGDLIESAIDDYPGQEEELRKGQQLYLESVQNTNRRTQNGDIQILAGPLGFLVALFINTILIVVLALWFKERLQIADSVPEAESAVGVVILIFLVIHVLVHYLRPIFRDDPGEVNIAGAKIAGNVLIGTLDLIHPSGLKDLWLWALVIIFFIGVVASWLHPELPIPVAAAPPTPTNTATPTPTDPPTPTNTTTPTPTDPPTPTNTTTPTPTDPLPDPATSVPTTVVTTSTGPVQTTSPPEISTTPVPTTQTPTTPVPTTLVTIPPLPEQTTPEAGATLISQLPDGEHEFTKVFIPGGEFLMGAPAAEFAYDDARPEITETVNPYWIDLYEVTNELFSTFLNITQPSDEELKTFIALDDDDVQVGRTSGTFYSIDRCYGNLRNGFQTESCSNYPVIEVSWDGAKAYCQWVGGSLPSEKQWEFATRGEDSLFFPWDKKDFSCSKANVDDSCQDEAFQEGCPLGENVVAQLNCDGYARTAPVNEEQFSDSPFGIYSLMGNVFEWVEDAYSASGYLNVSDDPREQSDLKVIRGGSSFRSDEPIRPMFWRRALLHNDTHPDVGFRCVYQY